ADGYCLYSLWQNSELQSPVITILQLQKAVSLHLGSVELSHSTPCSPGKPFQPSRGDPYRPDTSKSLSAPCKTGLVISGPQVGSQGLYSRRMNLKTEGPRPPAPQPAPSLGGSLRRQASLYHHPSHTLRSSTSAGQTPSLCLTTLLTAGPWLPCRMLAVMGWPRCQR
uniref:Uncharacterized protein n=1 Tax=Labrus bergylta TaxID=56723 RepID=A0A3Q3M4P9_9LABR